MKKKITYMQDLQKYLFVNNKFYTKNWIVLEDVKQLLRRLNSSVCMNQSIE